LLNKLTLDERAPRRQARRTTGGPLGWRAFFVPGNDLTTR
jgi:hypothetical protein